MNQPRFWPRFWCRAWLAAALLAASAAAVQQQPAPALAAGTTAPAHWTANIAEIRRVAGLIPGARPLRINMLKFAESHRTKNFSVLGAPAEPSVQSRTVFQVVYADGTQSRLAPPASDPSRATPARGGDAATGSPVTFIMIDSGMSEAVHKLLGRGAPSAANDPYFPDAAAQIQAALRRARLIVVTHEHGDHVDGVVEPPLGPELAPKTVLTRTQIEGLLEHPQFPQLKLTSEAAARYIAIDYDRYYPFAPGMALIKAPGHTPGSQMIYVQLANGREYLFCGDAAWHMDNIRLLRPKNAPWVKENQDEIMDQLRWLHELLSAEPNLTIVVSHDDEEQRELVARRLLGGKLE